MQPSGIRPTRPKMGFCVQEAIPPEDRLLKFHAMQEFMHLQFSNILAVGKIEAYGSLASNCLLPDSDVDLCVVLKGIEVIHASRALLQKAEARLRRCPQAPLASRLCCCASSGRLSNSRIRCVETSLKIPAVAG